MSKKILKSEVDNNTKPKKEKKIKITKLNVNKELIKLPKNYEIKFILDFKDY